MFNLRQTLLGLAIFPSVTGGLSLPSIAQPAVARPSKLPQLVAADVKPGFWRKNPKVRLVARSNACAVSPGLLDTMTLWHDRPVFIWQGKVAQVNLRDYETQSLLWSSTNLAEATVAYSGTDVLQPGKIYEWQLLGAQTTESDRRFWMSFKIMDAPQREKIAAELQALEQQQRSMGASAEAIAIAKADYFADLKLWADALQVVQEVKNPSAAFVQKRQSYVASLCTQNAPVSNAK